MDKNNLDDFFRKKFKDFSEVPDEKVWSAIESSLDQKQKKRVLLPIWWRMAGVAALLAVLFYIVNPFNSNVEPSIVDTETNIEKGKQSDDSLEILPNNPLKKDANEGLVEAPQNPSQDLNSRQIPEKGTLQPSAVTKINQAENAIDTNKARLAASDIAIDQNSNQLTEGQVAQKNNSQLDETIENQRQSLLSDNGNAKGDGNTAVDDKNIPNSTEIAKMSDEQALTSTDPDNVKDEDADASKKKISIFDEIEEESEVVDASQANRWSVGPTVAPVYFSSFGEGSPIHSNFVSNAKSGNLNLSYGLSVSYAISEKLSLRSGVHKVDYGYDTNDIQFSSSLAASTNNRIDNIDYALTSKNLIVQSNATGVPSQDAALSVSNEIAAPNPTRAGRMVQQFGYLEIPVELNYALIDSKFGVNLIGGVSSLFLVDNTVSLESGGAATDIGEANNINDLNFSTNFGVGFNYELSSKLQLQLEPMFKYQLNTFSGTAGNFQPFSLGVYSGLNFKF